MRILNFFVLLCLSFKLNGCFCSEAEEYNSLAECYNDKMYETLCSVYLYDQIIYDLTFSKIGNFLKSSSDEIRKEFFFSIARYKIDRLNVFNLSEENKEKYDFHIKGLAVIGNCPQPWILEYTTTYSNILSGASKYFSYLSTSFFDEDSVSYRYEYGEFVDKLREYISERNSMLQV